MAVNPLGAVTQASDGSSLTFTDKSTGTTSVTSRILTIYDADGNLLYTIDMGASLTATYPVTIDGVYVFIENFIDNGSAYQITIDYPAIQYYNLLQEQYASLITCGCDCTLQQQLLANNANECIYAALTDVLTNQLISANTKILAANTFINQALNYSFN